MKSKKTTLNPSQQKTIEHKYGPILVVAGAGTGKTRVITERIKYLIEKQNINSKQVLALTFTDKAANEMLERVGDIMPLGYEEPWIYTFHTFADRILRLEGLEIGLDPSYKILSYSEQWLLLRKNLFKFNLKYFRPLGNPTKFISAILKFISRLQDENISAEEFKKFAVAFKGDTENAVEEKTRWEELAHVYETYQKLKIEKSKMDFGDLITWTIKLFNERPNILKKYHEQFKHVLVDEFQDTNYAQYELVKLLYPVSGQKSAIAEQFDASVHDVHLDNRSLLVVGDDSQSIYKFRGAAVSNILQFMEDYPTAEMVTLLENYRSSQKILDAAYKLIKNNNPDSLESKLKISKELVSQVSAKTARSEKTDSAPQILQMETLEDEVDQVILKILELLGREPDFTYKDIAVLARANSYLDPLVLALRRYGLPYQLVGNRGLYDREEIRDVLALLRIIINPLDSISLYRVLSISTFNVPYNEIIKILSETRLRKINLWDVTQESKSQNIVSLNGKIKEFQEKITKLSPHEFVYELVNSTGFLMSFLNEENMENQLCIKNLDIFLNLIKKFENSFYDDSKEIPTIVDLIDYLDLVIEAGENPAQAEIEDIDTINLMTVHASKGLEFGAVFVINATSDRFPTKNRKDIIMLPDELIKETLPTGDEHIQEERRLFYVAMTRAKKYLFLTLGKNYGGKRDKIPSGFLTETGLKIEYVTELQKEETQTSLFGVESGFRKVSAQPIDYEIGNLSFSKLDKYKTCPLQYKYSYVLNIPTPPNPALNFGIAIHESLYDYHLKKSLGKKVELKDLLATYESKWIPLGYIDQDHQKLRFESGRKLLENYYNRHNNENIKHLGLEKWFDLKIGPYKFKGKIDRIDALPEGGVEIIDYKTGTLKDQKEIDKDDQLTFYSIGAKEALGYDVKKLSYYYVEDGAKVSTTRNAGQFESVKKEALEIVGKIKEGDFTAKSGMHCTWCDYKDICPFAYKG